MIWLTHIVESGIAFINLHIHSMKMEKTKVLIPEVTSNRLFELITHIYPAESISTQKLNGVFGRSKVYNLSATGESLYLLKRNTSTIALTTEGLNMGRALASKNLEDQHKILQDCALKNPVFEFVYSAIKIKKVMKNEEIGQKISVQFNKNWKNTGSYSRYGANCADILASAGLGDYLNGIYSIEKISVSDTSSGTSVPSVGFSKILNILRHLISKEKNLDTLVVELPTVKNRLSYELANCADLKLVSKKGDMYSITDIGRELIHPLNEPKICNIFANTLRKSPYSNVIASIETAQISDCKKIGEIVLHELRREGNDAYQIEVGKKFRNWLGSANLCKIQKPKSHKQSQFRVKKEKKLIEAAPVNMVDVEIQSTPVKKEEPLPIMHETVNSTVNAHHLFKIGGLLERIVLKVSMEQDIKKDIEELITICSQDASLGPYVSLLSSHYALYKEISDFRVLRADIDFLKNKLGG